MQLTPKSANILFTLLVSVVMTAVMSLAILLTRLGWSANFPLIWLGDFAVGCLFSIPTGFVVVPLLRRWIDGQTVRGPAPAPAGPLALAAEQAAVQEVVRQYAEAINAKDAAAFARVFDDEAVYINVVGVELRGRRQLEDWHRQLFAGTGGQMPDFSRAHLAVLDSRVSFVRPDVAYADVFWAIEGVRDGAGQPVPPRKGLTTWVLTKEAGAWHILRMSNKDLPG